MKVRRSRKAGILMMFCAFLPLGGCSGMDPVASGLLKVAIGIGIAVGTAALVNAIK